jgi:hypothetical protein
MASEHTCIVDLFLNNFIKMVRLSPLGTLATIWPIVLAQNYR